MVIYEYPFKQKTNIPECVLALGFFDGVHIAHRDLLETARREALERKISFGVFTFSAASNIKNGTARLYTDADKAEIFETLGANFVIFADFPEISGASAEKFVKKMLREDLNCQLCVAGFNFRFGKGAKAGADDLARLMSESGGEAVIREEIKGDGGETLSATLIRELITSGEIKKANRLLGSPYNIKGRVLHGRAVGRDMGFPTLNIQIAEGRIIPRLGVYASAIKIDGKAYLGVTNIGVCPTFKERAVHIETHVLDYEGDLYGRELRVFLLDFLREEKAFSSPEELKMQILVDKNTVIKENGDIKWQELGLK